MKTEKKPVSSNSNEKKSNNEIKMIAGSFLATIALFFTTCVVFDTTSHTKYKAEAYNENSVSKEANYSATKDSTLKANKEIAMEISNMSSNVADANIDNIAPVITLNKNEVNITALDNFDIKSNIKSVNDNFDGNVSYSDKRNNGQACYIISSNFNKNVAGEYTVTIKAYDTTNNESTVTYKIKVAPNPKLEQTSNRAASVDTSSVLAAANSLKGVRYRSGGTNPETGFDCSGFVNYVYAAVGKNISRSSSSQLRDGVAVDRSNLQVGDIIIWANDGSNSPAHSSIYAGGNSIIHATTNKGVHVNDIDQWDAFGQHIIGIRRI